MFRKYQPKGAKIDFSGISVRCTNQYLAFSDEVWEKCFDKALKLELFFEQESNLIGLKGSNLDGLRISKDPTGCYKMVRWPAFLRTIKFTFESATARKISKQGMVWVIEKEKEEVNT